MYAEFLDNAVFAVVGGDLRQARLANALAVSRYKVWGIRFNTEVYISDAVMRTDDLERGLSESNVIILPLPATLDGKTVNSVLSAEPPELADCVRFARSDAVILGGMLSEKFAALAEKCGIAAVDYAKREEFAVLNAVPTAEGAVGIAMAERPSVIRGSRCLVAGYGRVGRALASLLQAMGAAVSVSARKPRDLAAIATAGMEPVHISELAGHAGEYEIIFNTVPAMIFGEDILKALRRDCLVIDLASKPGGVDFGMAKRLGLRAVWALSLPGKVAPITAGDIIKDTVLNILRERRTS